MGHEATFGCGVWLGSQRSEMFVVGVENWLKCTV